MSRPNLLFVFADQMRYDVPDYAGGCRHVMPNLDALSRESINFSQAVSSNPVCGPFRACLFTGRNCTENGMVINEIRFNPHQKCIGHVLTEGGYRAGYIGKWHLYADELRNFYAPENSFTPPGEHRLGFDDYWAAYGFSHNYYGELAFYHTDTPERICAGDRYMPDVQTDLAIARMREYAANPEKPFALFLSYSTPHGPWRRDNVPDECYARFAGVEYQLPPNYAEEDDPHGDIWAHISAQNRRSMPEWMRIYDAMCANVDDNVGRLVETMRELGLDKNTILVFTSDHGECWGAHGRRQKSVFYEEAARVPFLLRLPGGEHARECDACLSTVDVMPTLLGLLDLPIPASVEGQNLAGLCRETDDAEPPFAFMQGTGTVAIYADGYEWRAIRDKRMTYGIWRRDGEEHLYDNIADPYQMHNLAADPAYAGVLEEMRTRLRRKMAEIGDSFPPASEADKNWVFRRRVWRGGVEEFDPCPWGDGARPADEPLYLDGGKRLAFYPIYDTRTAYAVADGTEILMDYLFYGAPYLRRVTLPTSLRQVNCGAFSECQIAEVELPEGCRIVQQNAFYRNSALRRVVLPRSLEKIVESAFDGCPNLILEVYAGTFGETWCRAHGKRFHVIEEEKQK